MEGLPANETAKVPISMYDRTWRRPSHFLRLYVFSSLHFVSRLSCFPGYHLLWTSFHHFCGVCDWLEVYAEKKTCRPWITTALNNPIITCRETAGAFWFFIPPSHLFSQRNTGRLETARQLAEVIMASGVDTVSEWFRNYTCSHIKWNESGVSTVEWFTCFEATRDCVFLLFRQQQRYSRVKIGFLYSMYESNWKPSVRVRSVQSTENVQV